jgi:hypothetical protein
MSGPCCRFGLWASASLAACAFVAALGCTPDYGGRKPVSGTVKLKGELIKDAVIEFFPISDVGSKSGAQIVDGKYAIPAEFGLMPGKYKVILTAGDGRTIADSDLPPGPSGANIISKELFPPEYNKFTKQQVEVTEKGPNVFDYDVP